MLFRKNIKVESIEKITLKMSGMRTTEEYEIISKGDKVEISLYLASYNKDMPRELIKRAEYDAVEFIAFLNECKIGKWDGFSGSNPPGIRDGYMFRFTAEINGGTVIEASGSNNYPNNFGKFRQELTKILSGE